MMPLLVFIQRLARNMTSGREVDRRLLLHYVCREHPEHGDWLMAITQSLEMRTLVLVLDGIDEVHPRIEA